MARQWQGWARAVGIERAGDVDYDRLNDPLDERTVRDDIAQYVAEDLQEGFGEDWERDDATSKKVDEILWVAVRAYTAELVKLRKKWE